MSLSWQDVACGLPVPELPILPEGWRTRFFSAVLVLPDGQAQRLRSVAQGLMLDGATVSLPHGAGPDWPCRLIAAPDFAASPDGRWHARLEFEVIEPEARGLEETGPEISGPEDSGLALEERA